MKWLTTKSRREKQLKKAISDVFIMGDTVIADIPWKSAEKFAHDRGAETTGDNGQRFVMFEMLVNQEAVTVSFSKEAMNGKTYISVENTEKLNDELMKQVANIKLGSPNIKINKEEQTLSSLIPQKNNSEHGGFHNAYQDLQDVTGGVTEKDDKSCTPKFGQLAKNYFHTLSRLF